MPRPLAVAITGGIGAGKTEALRAFARHGAAVVSSDEIVHRLLREKEVRQALVARFGEQVVGRGGEIDRGEIAKIVFADRAELAWLETLLHPLVAQEYLRWREELRRLPDPPALCVTEVPLLYEVGGETRFDAVVAIGAAGPVRVRRTSVADVDEREARLLPEREKLERADYAYVNEGSLDDLDAFVARVTDELAARA